MSSQNAVLAANTAEAGADETAGGDVPAGSRPATAEPMNDADNGEAGEGEENDSIGDAPSTVRAESEASSGSEDEGKAAKQLSVPVVRFANVKTPEDVARLAIVPDMRWEDLMRMVKVRLGLTRIRKLQNMWSA